jgi:pyruvate dehydrogenase E1 component beta subunit
MTYAEAVVEALLTALREDDRVRLMGGYFLGITAHRGLMERVRSEFLDRIWYPPIAENGYVGAAIGASIAGLRPIVDIATASFVFQAFSQVVNEAANIHYMTGGQTSVPVLFHCVHGVRGGGAAQHSHSPQAMLWQTPGIKLVTPSTPADVLGLVRTAMDDPNPIFWIDHSLLFGVTGDVPVDRQAIPFGVADIKRHGTDVTVVATSLMVQRSLKAAQLLAEEGLSVEVVDPRTLVPLDRDAILASVARTGRLVIVDECHEACGVAAEIAAQVAEHGFDLLRRPIRRVATANVPVPFSRPLEHAIEPTVERIVDAVRALA